MKSKRLWEYIRRLIPIFIFGVLLSGSVLAFNSPTHRYVTETSLECIFKINETVRCLDDESEKYLKDKNYSEVIAKNSITPDIDEAEGIYKCHFYNPMTEKNFMREKISACTKCVEHFNKAVDYYKESKKNKEDKENIKNIEKAFEELGRAAHFMEDLNTPVHTGYDLPSDAVLKFPLHVRFEKTCDLVMKECKNDFLPKEKESIKETLRYFYVNDIESLAKVSSLLSSDNFYYLINEKEPNEKSIAKDAIRNAQYNVTGMLCKFFAQVGEQETEKGGLENDIKQS